ncbi:pogo transposable element with KRAB domain [Trichonephila clavipes]|nr:pogo transposable element with KRAB domain [Trichonephila clavipes]
MDSMKAHVSENVKNALKSASSKIAIIPGGLTKKLQPLDVGINRSFKSKVRKLWNSGCQMENKTTKMGKLKRASYENVSNWILNAWNDVAETTLEPTDLTKCCELLRLLCQISKTLPTKEEEVILPELVFLRVSGSGQLERGWFRTYSPLKGKEGRFRPPATLKLVVCTPNSKSKVPSFDVSGVREQGWPTQVTSRDTLEKLYNQAGYI